MVNFNGIDLSDVSEKIRVVDVVVSSPSVNLTTINPALRNGDIFARKLFAPRTVSVSFTIMESRMETRAEIISDVVEWASSDEEKRLFVPQHADAFLEAVCTEYPEDSAANFWDVLTLVFRASNPFFHSIEEKSAAVGEKFTVVRSVPPDWRIEQDVTGQLTYPMWSVGSKQISFSSISAGKLVIKSKDLSATLDGKSVIPSMMLGSRFFSLKKGENLVDAQKGAGGIIYWREAFI